MASVLIVIYVAWRFEFKQGIAAIIAVLHDVLVVVGVFSIFQIEVDSAFVAAVLTIVGYSIMDTIVIFDRIRENSLIKKKGEAVGGRHQQESVADHGPLDQHGPGGNVRTGCASH